MRGAHRLDAVTLCAALIAWMLLRCASGEAPLPSTNASGAEGHVRYGIDSLYSDAKLEEGDIFVESDTD